MDLDSFLYGSGILRGKVGALSIYKPLLFNIILSHIYSNSKNKQIEKAKIFDMEDFFVSLLPLCTPEGNNPVRRVCLYIFSKNGDPMYA